ncbi:unnamed protein product [Bursaphelenchus xylophilus]|uniref:(pine wood nematode) hypothetical protein n=1 Tax=Bursaphelenchus xylophilus TaxID=6326 RepID=A0A1I7SVF1_BURXY|nr:unnamed protein product [Bursaphelenchus xylophilus]CAG9101358.1 unnamed protein product [Bursaphelenchus xylophilus]
MENPLNGRSENSYQMSKNKSYQSSNSAEYSPPSHLNSKSSGSPEDLPPSRPVAIYGVDSGESEKAFSFESTKEQDCEEDVESQKSPFLLMPPIRSRTSSANSQQFFSTDGSFENLSSPTSFSSREVLSATSQHNPAIGTIMNIGERIRSFVNRRDSNPSTLTMRRASINSPSFTNIAEPSDSPSLQLFTEVYDGTQPSNFERSRRSLQSGQVPPAGVKSEDRPPTGLPNPRGPFRLRSSSEVKAKKRQNVYEEKPVEKFA